METWESRVNADLTEDVLERSFSSREANQSSNVKKKGREENMTTNRKAFV